MGKSTQKVVIAHTSQINQLIKQLISIRQENAMFKIRLSELVDKSVMTDFLSRAEKFNNELIANDESIALLFDSATHIQKKLRSSEPALQQLYLEKNAQLTKDLAALQSRLAVLRNRLDNGLSGAVESK